MSNKLQTVSKSRLPSNNKKSNSNLNIVHTSWGNFELSANDISNIVQGGVQLFSSVAEGKKNIAEIQTNSDAEIKRIEAEANKILDEAKAKIGILNTKNQNWHSRFDKKQDLLTEIINKFRTDSSLSENDKDRIFQVALKIISEESDDINSE